ncbi:carboxypeptidase regulatory-like domain-containing protein [Mucilaginibacter sp. JRF]|uniref:carboxypeptidase-like regulatory domain-containing protein n=1 Tax=Mucilaginibacter sp. JRF TaxID=2780088 RepID=UPI001882ECCD|nr:carboxypeptidase-like regulatory domain-containing protein [Mucilaginibacter sp. JRF]MBE9585137.1 carboxypeptidase regulatory-like domain-containing protein [Mucilaginibacter sp. JRF]
MPKLLSRFIVVAVCLSVATLMAFVKIDDAPLDKITSALAEWKANIPQEKIYLHTDKPYYAIGDTLYFKAYITAGAKHMLSAVSGAVYVDLINERNQVEKSVKLPVINGLSSGTIALEDGLADGNYRLRAYTEWMRNAGDDFFFDHTLAVVKVHPEVAANIRYQYEQHDGKPVVYALLTYTNEGGQPIAGKDVKCDIKNGSKIAVKRLETDANGQVKIQLSPEQVANYKQTYIQTTMEMPAKREVLKVFALKPGLVQSDMQFFPEGGVMVNGFVARVAFKAVSPDGKGTDVKGVVLDDINQEVVAFESSHLGMGTFNFMPQTGKKYTAKVNYTDGSAATIPLPAAVDNGYALAIHNLPGDSVLVRIYTSAAQLQQGATVSLVAHNGGDIGFAATIKPTKPMTSVWVEKKPLVTGIAHFSLFDQNSEPLNERICFINKNDQMVLEIRPEKSVYQTREKVNINIDALQTDGKPVIGSFSITTVNESMLPEQEDNENSIQSQLLLTADLKGYVEKPGYYFNSKNAEAARHLDNLMMTQGYRRFVWKELLSGKPVTPQFKAEKLATVISGKLLTLGGKPVAGGNVLLFSPAMPLTDTTTDADGRFTFNVVIPESIKFNVQGKTAKGSTNVQIVLDKTTTPGTGLNKNQPDLFTNVYKNAETFVNKRKAEDQKYGTLTQGRELDEVKIKAKQINRVGALGGYSIPEAAADQVFIPDSTKVCGALWICLMGELRGVTFSQNGTLPNWPHSRMADKLAPMIVVVDGSRIDSLEASDLLNGNGMAITDIQKIQVVRTSMAQISMLGAPAIVIQTKRGFTRKSYTPSQVLTTPRGYARVKEFYSPRYDVKNDPNVPDLRSTIYWNPDIRTNKLGKATASYFNADGSGRYKVTVEGIGASGVLGRSVFYYNVE